MKKGDPTEKATVYAHGVGEKEEEKEGRKEV